MRSFLSFGWLKPAFVSTIPLICFAAAGRAADVSFYAVFKGEKYNQVNASSPTLGSGNPYRFGAVVAPALPGAVQSASVSGPGGTPQPLTPDPLYDWLSINAKFPTHNALEAAAPTGNYTLVVNTVHDGQKTLTLQLPAETFPPAPHINNWTAAQVVNPTTDFALKWDEWGGGTTNDLILVLVGNQNTGAINFRSPNPLQPGALDGTATSVVIPGGSLQPNTPYLVELSFFKIVSVDAASYAGAAGLASFESFTDSGIMTTNSTVTTPLELTAVNFSSGGFVLRLTGQVGRTYRVQGSPNLSNWSDLVTTNLPNASVDLLDPQAGNFTSRYYRALLAD